jgi:nucleoside-diphosphate-sugar epimerase
VRVFVAGASGVVGRRLLPRLVAAGHEVTGMTRRPERTEAIRGAGAQAVVCDALDGAAVREAVAASRPDAVVQHLTDLPKRLGPRNLARAYRANDRVRREGTANLVAAAEAAGARRFIAQNVCFLYAHEGGPVKDEDAPLMDGAPPPFDRSIRVYREMEARVVGAGLDGLVLRCGWWYGPGTTYGPDGYMVGQLRRRLLPIVGDGAGVFSFVHVDDVAGATVDALARGGAGIYNVCDDEPAPVREWLPALAAAAGAPRPLRVPAWLARMAVGRFPSLWFTDARGASNAKARRELGWVPAHPTWRTGFPETFAA